MPLVAYKNLPSFNRLRKDGHLILSEDRALRQNFRELHVGLLNMMPDAALEVTERQFFRLVGRSDRIVQFYMHPFTIDGLERSTEAQLYTDQHYQSFDEIKKQGLDALIITGANVKGKNLENEAFYDALKDVLTWARDNVTSILCSCLATHAVMKALYNEDRIALESKLHGVYKHKVLNERMPLTRGINTSFYAPHSRHNMITKQQFTKHNMHILAESAEAGVHLACSNDGLRLICFQGHPEYDRISLFKEFKRDLKLYIEGKIERCPAMPANIIEGDASTQFQNIIKQAITSRDINLIDNDVITALIENTWQDTARSMIQNWIGAVYQVTGYKRHEPFMQGIDVENISHSLML